MRVPETMRNVWQAARPRLRDGVAEALRVVGATRPARFAADRLTVATFHRVLPAELLAEYPIPDLAVTPDELDHLIGVFRQHYTVGPLAEVAERFDRGDRPAKPLLAVTFDDGQRDNLTHAHPVLSAHGVRASFFVVTDAVEHDSTLWHDRIAYAVARPGVATLAGVPALLAELRVDPAAPDLPNAAVGAAKSLTPVERDGWMSRLEGVTGADARPAWDGMLRWDDLRQLHEAGHEIGSHSTAHPILPLVADDDALDDEIAGSRRVLAERLGAEVPSFCYPNGDHDARVVAAVRRAGYRWAVSTEYGINGPDQSSLLLRRCELQGRFARNAVGRLVSAGVLLRLTGRIPGA